MDKNQQDRHLETPSEANRDKHINFTALENDEPDPADERTTDEKEERERREKREENKNTDYAGKGKLTDNPRHATDESSTNADSPQDAE
jgi:hypothetical protein